MVESIRLANLGNDGFGEDPTVNELQLLAAKMLGKEDALLVTSGTQANLICILAQTNRDRYILGEADCHIFHNEGDSYSHFGGVRTIRIRGRKGVMNPEEIENSLESFRGEVDLITVENTHNRAGGTIIPIENLRGIKKIVDSNGSPKIHIDGSRIFNAAVALRVDASELTRPADSVMFCLSKGLCAPIGSVIAGSAEFIESARIWRRKLGGQMRQAGIIAAPGIVALKKMVDRLGEDHEKARHFAKELNGFGDIQIDLETVQTNIVWFDMTYASLSADTLVSRTRGLGVALGRPEGNYIRAVFYNDISDDDVDFALESIQSAFGRDL